MKEYKQESDMAKNETKHDENMILEGMKRFLLFLPAEMILRQRLSQLKTLKRKRKNASAEK